MANLEQISQECGNFLLWTKWKLITPNLAPVETLKLLPESTPAFQFVYISGRKLTIVAGVRVAIRPALRRTVRHLRPSSAIRHRPMPDKQKSSFCAIVQILIVSKGLTIDCKNPKPIRKYFTFFLRCLRFKCL